MTIGAGSLGVLEQYFGGVLGDDFSESDVRALSPQEFHELRLLLSAAVPGRDIGPVGVDRWLQAQSLSARASTIIDGYSTTGVTGAALLVHQALVADPISIVRSLDDVVRGLGTLAAWRPLIASGAIVLYPSWTGLDALGPRYSLEPRPLAQWPSDVRAWAERLWQTLPQGQVGEVAERLTAGLIAASSFDVEAVAISRYAPMVEPALIAGGLRPWKLASVVMPKYAGLSSNDVVAIRESTDLYERVGHALDLLVDQLSDDPDRARRQGPSMARELLEPVADELMKESRRSPSLSSLVVGTWALSATAVDLGLGTMTPGGLMMASAVPVGLLADWVRKSRRRATLAPAVRVLRTLSAGDTTLTSAGSRRA